MTDDYTPTTEEVRGTYVAYSFRDCFEKPGPTQPKGEWAAEFNRWLSAHDAEVRASVLAEQGEPEWEYGYGNQPPLLWSAPSREQAERWRASGERVWKRRAAVEAGPWLPVEENTEALTEGSER